MRTIFEPIEGLVRRQSENVKKVGEPALHNNLVFTEQVCGRFLLVSRRLKKLHYPQSLALYTENRMHSQIRAASRIQISRG